MLNIELILISNHLEWSSRSHRLIFMTFLNVKYNLRSEEDRRRTKLSNTGRNTSKQQAKHLLYLSQYGNVFLEGNEQENIAVNIFKRKNNQRIIVALGKI